ncbi:hypothetical protein K4039_12710 [Lyngbya sp. CCAP 1446/10]|uniref:hypothetical protein n=1 Tax=Lyngbya sp. CCAP 1446/10 TaxID=439293 RepID=UPI00223749BD|nr:hypothetical protein [Lyngbya sp. CCAP 1446/10]MCW6050924.1 hypothetical protein [Lyngbya sp. CCAP 1446/10]
MKRKTLSFLVVALFTVTAGMAAQVNAASQEVQKPNLPSVQAQAKASQPIPVALPTDAEIVMKGGQKNGGRVVQIDEKGQKLVIQRGRDTRSLPLSQVEKIVFANNAVVYSAKGGPIVRGERPPANRTETWRGIPMNAFRLLNPPDKGQAELNLGSVISADDLDYIRQIMLGNGKNTRQYVVDEMQFDVKKKTMTITATPY